jgi:hypothetical protein
MAQIQFANPGRTLRVTGRTGPGISMAIVLYLWSRDAAKRGVETWHIAILAVIGGISIPVDHLELEACFFNPNSDLHL